MIESAPAENVVWFGYYDAAKWLFELYKNPIITTEEYCRDKEDCERQIGFWEVRTSDMQIKAIEFGRVIVAFSPLLDLWQNADSDSRPGLARGLIQYLVVDLDLQQIVDYRLHPWADHRISILKYQNRLTAW